MNSNIINNKKKKEEARKEKQIEISLNNKESEKNYSSSQQIFENQENCIWLSSKDVSKILSLSENAIRIMVYRNQIKSYKLGRRLRFKYYDIARLLNKGSVYGD